MMNLVMRIVRQLSVIVSLVTIATAPAGADTISSEAARFTVEVVAAGLEHPWGLAVLDDGRMLVTEKPGRLRQSRTSSREKPSCRSEITCCNRATSRPT